MEDISGIMALYSQCAIGQHAVLYLHPGNLLQSLRFSEKGTLTPSMNFERIGYFCKSPFPLDSPNM